MKDLLKCWRRRRSSFSQTFVLISTCFILLCCILFVFDSEIRTKTFTYQEDTSIVINFLRPIFMFSLSSFLVICFVIYHWINDLFGIILFKGRFGFLPPITQEGRCALQNHINAVLKKLANCLQKSYNEEEELLKIESGLEEDSKELISEIVSKYKPADIPHEVLSLEENFLKRKKKIKRSLRLLRKRIKKEKEDFYSSRDLARKMGFEAVDSFKKYLEA